MKNEKENKREERKKKKKKKNTPETLIISGKVFKGDKIESEVTLSTKISNNP